MAAGVMLCGQALCVVDVALAESTTEARAAVAVTQAEQVVDAGAFARVRSRSSDFSPEYPEVSLSWTVVDRYIADEDIIATPVLKDPWIEVPDDWERTVVSRDAAEPAPVSPRLDTRDPEEAPASDADGVRPDTPEFPDPTLAPATPMPIVDFPDVTEADLGDRQRLPHRLIFNGEPVAGLSAYVTAQGELLLPLAPLAALLGDGLSMDAEGGRVSYVRSRDGARFTLEAETGEVKANGRSVGYLNEVGQVDTTLGLFPANAVQVFAGLHVKRDDGNDEITLTLDKRLRYVSGFKLYVNGQLLPYLDPQPRALGHVLLLPLRPLVEELGSRLTVSPDGNTLTVTRYQDNARISLNLISGLVQVDGTPVGNAPNLAYADRNLLLLPKESVASLTGTYITIVPGSRRIDVDLDGELARIIHPGDSIQSRAASSPPSVESAKVFYDSEHRASAVVRGHYSRYNLRYEYETPTTQGDDGFTPEWMQLYAESIDGWGLGIGDHNTQKGELTGVDAARIRGAYFYNPTNDGVLVGTLGKAQSGVRTLDEGDAVPTFGPEVGGVRYYANHAKFELGLAARNDDDADTRAIVGSSYRVFEHPDFSWGDLYQRTDIALGVYESDDRRRLGGQAAWEGRLEPTRAFSVSARSDYQSAELAAEYARQVLEETDDEDDNGDELTALSLEADRLSYGLNASYRPNTQMAYSLGHSRELRGVFQEDDAEDVDYWRESSIASMSLKPWDHALSPWTFFSWTRASASDDESVRRLNAQALWHYDRYNLLLRHEDQRGDESGHGWLTALQLGRDPWERYFRQGAKVALTPRLNAWKDRQTESANLGALLSYQSGELLGPRTRFAASYGKNLAIQRIESDTTGDDDETFQNSSDYVNASLTYRYNTLLSLKSHYYSNLEGDDNLYASVTAYYAFNPPRHISQSRENAGLLMGQVFLDRNYDGVQQADEPAIPGARVAIKGTRLGLNADPEGRFTIQNLPVGVYRILPDVSRLPLGYMGDPQAISPVRIGDSQITEIKIPVVKGHQLSGVVYVDRNRNGALDDRDERLENIGLELDTGQETASAAFGQYAFDFLPPGQYRVRLQADTLPDGVQLADGDALVVDLTGDASDDRGDRLEIRLLDHPEPPDKRVRAPP